MLKTITDKNMRSRGVHEDSNSRVKLKETMLLPGIVYFFPLRKEYN
jgi:hypothetical protein